MEKNYIISKEQYLAVKANWTTKKRAAWEHVVYNLLRSKPITNGFNEKTKNIQGINPWHAFIQASWTARITVQHYKEGQFEKLFGCPMPEGFLELIKKGA